MTVKKRQVKTTTRNVSKQSQVELFCSRGAPCTCRQGGGPKVHRPGASGTLAPPEQLDVRLFSSCAASSSFSERHCQHPSPHWRQVAPQRILDRWGKKVVVVGADCLQFSLQMFHTSRVPLGAKDGWPPSSVFQAARHGKRTSP